MNLLVSPAWLAARLSLPETIVLDATLPPIGQPVEEARSRYLECHLPGAVFFDIEALSEQDTTLPHMLPTPERFAGEMEKLGISDEATLVVYEQGDLFSAPRAWWMLRVFGAQRVFVLDGGLRAWKEAGLPTDGGAVPRAPAMFRAELQKEVVKSFAEVQEMLGKREQMVDARSATRFAGTAPEPRPHLRSGHMTGAINVPYTDLTDGPHMRSVEEMTRVFRSKSVDLQRPVTTTCGSGITAAVVALGLQMCGAPEVSLYDGSWTEYAQQPGAVIESAP